MSESRGNFGVLTIDVMRLIFIDYLPLAEGQNAKLLNKEFRNLLIKNEERLWEKRLNWHFPVIEMFVPSYEKKQTALDKFKIVYEIEYRNLKPRQRKIITLLKENDVQALKQMILTQEDIDFMLDINNPVNICLVKRMQATTRKYLFENVITKNLSADERPRQFLWAILLKQHDFAKDCMVDNDCLEATYGVDTTPNDFAAMVGDAEIYKLLTVYDPTIPLIDLIPDAIDCAAMYGHTEFVNDMLVEMQDDKKLQEKYVLAAAKAFAEYGHVACLEFLMSRYFVNMNAKKRSKCIVNSISAACEHNQVAVLEKIYNWCDQAVKTDSFDSQDAYQEFIGRITTFSRNKLISLLIRDKCDNTNLIKLLINRSLSKKYELSSAFTKAVSDIEINIDIVLLFIDGGLDISSLWRNSSARLELYIKLLKTAIQKNSFDLFVKVFNTIYPFTSIELPIANNILELACKHGRKEIVEFFINSLKENGVKIIGGDVRNALKAALLNDHVDMVQLLMEHGANIKSIQPNFRRLCGEICLNGAINSLQFLQKEFPDEWKEAQSAGIFADFMCIAARAGHKEVVELFLQNSVDVNAKIASRYSALTYAVEKGHVAVVELLHDEYKAETPSKDELTRQFLKSTSEYIFNLGKMKSLLLLGADVNARDDKGENAFKLILSRENPMDTYAAVKCLIDAGFSLSAKDKNGFTALDYAVQMGNAIICRLLLENGADISPAFEMVCKKLLRNYEKYHVVLEAFCQYISQHNPDKYIALMLEKSNYDALGVLQRFGLLAEMPPVLSAAINHKVDEVKKLVAAKADINETFRGVTCLIFALRGNLLAEACAMVKLDLDEITQAKYDAAFKKEVGNNLHMRQLLVMEVVLLTRYIKKRGSIDEPERHTFFGIKSGPLRIEKGDTKTNKVAAAKKRLKQLLGEEVDYEPADLNALKKSDLNKITKFSHRRK